MTFKHPRSFNHLAWAALIATCTMGPAAATAAPIAMAFEASGFYESDFKGYFSGEDLDGDGWIRDEFGFSYASSPSDPTDFHKVVLSGLSGVSEITRAIIAGHSRSAGSLALDTGHPLANITDSTLKIDFEIATGHLALNASGYTSESYERFLVDIEPSSNVTFIGTGGCVGKGCGGFSTLDFGTNLLLTPVPEPATWAMAAAGLGLAGAGAMRRKRLHRTA